MVALTLVCVVTATMRAAWAEYQYQILLARIRQEVDLTVADSLKYRVRNPSSTRTDLLLTIRMINSAPMRERDRTPLVARLEREQPDLDRLIAIEESNRANYNCAVSLRVVDQALSEENLRD